MTNGFAQVAQVLIALPIHKCFVVDLSDEQRITVLRLRELTTQQKEEKAIPPSELDPEQRLSAMISKYGKKKGRMIADGRVWPTISLEMARDSWGEPEDIHKSTTHRGSTEKWVYTDNRYLFFKNGSLESWKQ